MTHQNDSAAATRTGIALLILRIAVGGTLVAHGLQKLFVYTVPGVSDMFAGMGIPLAELVAPVVIAIELVGGLAIVVGIGTRAAALLATASMLGATAFAHVGNGFFASDGGMELTLLIAAMTLALAIAGPGRLSVHGVALRGRAPLLA